MALKIRVIGVGSAICCDDAVGLAVLRELSKESLPQNVELVEAGTAGMSLMELMAGAEKVILVDAITGGGQPGKVHRLRVQDLVERRGHTISAHELGPVEALRLLDVLNPNQVPEQVMILGVEISNQTGVGKRLTPQVRAAIPEVVKAIMAELRPASSCC